MSAWRAPLGVRVLVLGGIERLSLCLLQAGGYTPQKLPTLVTEPQRRIRHATNGPATLCLSQLCSAPRSTPKERA